VNKDVITAVDIPRHQVTGTRSKRHITAIPTDTGPEAVTISLDLEAVHRYSRDVILEQGGAIITTTATVTTTASSKPGRESDK
jgi:hypothetical protein